MQLSIKINDAFHYSPVPMIISGVVFGIVLIVSIVILIRKNIKRTPIIEEHFSVNVGEVRDKYVKELNELEQEVSRGAIANRKAYQTLSICIRSFVFEVTNIDMRKFTLSDFDQNGAKMKTIYPLIVEYYRPEFSEDSNGDIVGAIENAKKVVELWR